MTPTVGRIVHFFPAVDDHELGGAVDPGPIAAIITGVAVGDERGTVNLTLFPDSAVGRASTVTRQGIGLRKDAGARNAWDWPEKV